MVFSKDAETLGAGLSAQDVLGVERVAQVVTALGVFTRLGADDIAVGYQFAVFISAHVGGSQGVGLSAGDELIFGYIGVVIVIKAWRAVARRVSLFGPGSLNVV